MRPGVPEASGCQGDRIPAPSPAREGCGEEATTAYEWHTAPLSLPSPPYGWREFPLLRSPCYGC